MPDFSQIQNNIRETVMRLPIIVGNAAVNWTVDSFEKQAWRGMIIQPWQARNPKAKRNVGRALLIMSGSLRRSIRILRTTYGSVTFGSDLAYAAAHNNGVNGMVTVNSFSRNKYGKAKASELNKFTKSGAHRTKSVTYISNTSEVRSFSRNMNLPRRQFMPAEDSDSPIFRADMEAVIRKELEPFFGKL